MKYISSIFLLIIACSCSDVRKPEKEALQQAFFDLMTGDGAEVAGIQKVEFSVGELSRVYGVEHDQESLQELSKCLSEAFLSGGDPLIAKYGSNRIKIGKVKIYAPKVSLEYGLYRAAFRENLFCIRVYLVGDSIGSTLLYFDGDSLSKPNGSGCALWRVISASASTK